MGSASSRSASAADDSPACHDSLPRPDGEGGSPAAPPEPAPAQRDGKGRRMGRGRRKKAAHSQQQPEGPAEPKPPHKKKKRLRHTILELQSQLERCQEQLREESERHDRAVARLRLMSALAGIARALDALAAPDHTPATDEAALAQIEEHTLLVRSAVFAAGDATSLGARGGWSGIDCPFIPPRPFLEHFLALREVPLGADPSPLVERFRGLTSQSEMALAAYMERFEAGSAGPTDDPDLDARLVQLALEMEGPLIGALFFTSSRALEILTAPLAVAGEAPASAKELWDAYGEALLPPTDGQDLYFDVLHEWWARESSRLNTRRRELGAAALAAVEDAQAQAEIVEEIEAAASAWVLAKVAGALVAHLSVCSAVHVVATVVGVLPHWATLTGVLEALHARRTRLRAATAAAAAVAAADTGIEPAEASAVPELPWESQS